MTNAWVDRGHIRAAVVQLDFQLTACVPSPLIAEPIVLLPPLKGIAPLRICEPWQSRLETLKREITVENEAFIRRRASKVLAHLDRMDVDLVVFPEYSIPASALAAIEETAGRCAVIAGSHSVTEESIGVLNGLNLGIPVSKDDKGRSICPVRLGPANWARIDKLTPSQWEMTTPKMKLGKEWRVLRFTDRRGDLHQFAVLLCIDYINEDHSNFQARVDRNWRKQVGFVVVPSYTPSLDLFQYESFRGALYGKKPVLYANVAQTGGSQIFSVVAEMSLEEGVTDRSGTVQLGPGDEAAVVVDIQLGAGQIAKHGPSTLPTPPTPTELVARLPLLSPNRFPSYMDLCEGIKSADDATKMIAIAEQAESELDGLLASAEVPSVIKENIRRLRCGLDRHAAYDESWFKNVVEYIEVDDSDATLARLHADLLRRTTKELEELRSDNQLPEPDRRKINGVLTTYTSAQRSRLSPSRATSSTPGPGSDSLPPAHVDLDLATPAIMIGRDDEVEELGQLLREKNRRKRRRLITLTGAGMVGKTTLARAVMDRVEEEFTNKAKFIRFETRPPDPLEVLWEIALKVDPRKGRYAKTLDEVRELLRKLDILLVLDNFEDLVDATDLLIDLLNHCQDLRLLVTSREPLQAKDWELEYPVRPLSLPSQHDPLPPATELSRKYEAIGLFEAFAQNLEPTFKLTDENAPAVVEICRYAEGIPGEIVMLAAWMDVVLPEQLLAEIEKLIESGDAREAMLIDRRRGTPKRQRSAFNSAEFDYERMHEHQRVFRCLSVFQGGFTLPAAIEVTGKVYGSDPDQDVLSSIQALKRKNILSAVEGIRDGGNRRFRMHGSVREYGLRRLADHDELEAAKAAHTTYFLDLAERSAGQMRGPLEAREIAGLEAEHDNLVAALQWATKNGDAETALRLAGALWQFWNIRGYLAQGRTWLDGALDMAGDGIGDARIEALHGAATLAWVQNEHGDALRYAEELEHVAKHQGNDLGVAEAIYLKGLVARSQKSEPKAVDHFTRALSMFRRRDRRGDRRARPWIMLSLSNLGSIALNQARALRDTGRNADAEQLLAKAEASHEEALTHARAAEWGWGLAVCLAKVGDVERERNKLDEALLHYLESLHLRHDQANIEGVADAFVGLGCIVVRLGASETAAKLFGQAEALRAQAGIGLSSANENDIKHHKAEALRSLDPASFEQAWALGRSMKLDGAMALARSLLPRG